MSERLVTEGKIVEVKGKHYLTHECRRDRLPEPPATDGEIWREKGKEMLEQNFEEEERYPTFEFTTPRFPEENTLRVALEYELTVELGGGFTSWDASGVWNNKGSCASEKVTVYRVSTARVLQLREIVKRYLYAMGEKEIYFLHVGEHEIIRTGR